MENSCFRETWVFSHTNLEITGRRRKGECFWRRVKIFRLGSFSHRRVYEWHYSHESSPKCHLKITHHCYSSSTHTSVQGVQRHQSPRTHLNQGRLLEGTPAPSKLPQSERTDFPFRRKTIKMREQGCFVAPSRSSPPPPLFSVRIWYPFVFFPFFSRFNLSRERIVEEREEPRGKNKFTTLDENGNSYRGEEKKIQGMILATSLPSKLLVNCLLCETIFQTQHRVPASFSFFFFRRFLLSRCFKLFNRNAQKVWTSARLKRVFLYSFLEFSTTSRVEFYEIIIIAIKKGSSDNISKINNHRVVLFDAIFLYMINNLQAF